MRKVPTLYDAVAGFLGPLCAEYARILDEGNPDMPVTVSLGGYDHKTTLATLKELDLAYCAAFEAKCKRDEKRARGTLL
jgi:hypothetical protein